MLINVDAKGLEWVAALAQSKDKVGIDEYNSGFDIHTDNQRGLELPTRVVAKNFLFRTIYADETSGGAFAFAHDPKFTHVSDSVRWWQKRIDTFYTKYEGLKRWHEYLLRTVGSTGRWTNPTGRIYVFGMKTLKNGDKVLPKTQIYNWPVQGLGAELMSILRVSLRKRLKSLDSGVKPLVTVHDSVLLDVPQELVYPVAHCIDQAFKGIRHNMLKLFDFDLGLEVKGEISVGNDWENMKELTKEELQEHSSKVN
jgi:DNA polymerase I-like protein with 3'-5' exonuclease and polymerase domains